jgi:chromosome segregation ATPase
MSNGDSGNGKIDVVAITSDALHEVNMALASLLPTESGYNNLEQKRDELEARLKRLVREFFKDNTKRFIDAGSQLVQVNERMKADLRNLQNLKDAIESITNLINSLDNFIKTVFPAGQ